MKKMMAAAVLMTALFSTVNSFAQDGYIGDIKMFAGNFAPRNWAFCNGQLLSIAQNQALFAILGTTYGGNGTTNFALPDLRGRVPIHYGSSTGPGLSPRSLGEAGGSETVTLTAQNLPAHTHSLSASTAAGTSNSPTGGVLANTGVFDKEYAASPNTTMSNGAIGSSGNNAPVSIMQPYTTVNFVICLFGIFPSQN